MWFCRSPCPTTWTTGCIFRQRRQGTDYQIYIGTGNSVYPSGSTRQFAAGDQRHRYRIRIFGDTDREGTEYFSIRIQKGGLRPEAWGVPFLYSSPRMSKSAGRALFISQTGESDGKRNFPGPYFEDRDHRLFQFRDHGQDAITVDWWGYATSPEHTIQLTEGGPSRSYGFKVSDAAFYDDHGLTGEVLRMRPHFGDNTHDKLQCSWDNTNWRNCAGLLTHDLDRRYGDQWVTLHIRASNGKYLADEEFTIRYRFASSKYGMQSSRITSGWIKVRVTDCTTCPEPVRQDGPGRMTFHNSRADALSGAGSHHQRDPQAGRGEAVLGAAAGRLPGRHPRHGDHPQHRVGLPAATEREPELPHQRSWH